MARGGGASLRQISRVVGEDSQDRMSGCGSQPGPRIHTFPPKNPWVRQALRRGPYTQIPTPVFRPQTLWPKVELLPLSHHWSQRGQDSEGEGISCGQILTPKPRPHWHLPGHIPGTPASGPHFSSGRRACHSRCAEEETKAQRFLTYGLPLA